MYLHPENDLDRLYDEVSMYLLDYDIHPSPRTLCKWSDRISLANRTFRDEIRFSELLSLWQSTADDYFYFRHQPFVSEFRFDERSVLEWNVKASEASQGCALVKAEMDALATRMKENDIYETSLTYNRE